MLSLIHLRDKLFQQYLLDMYIKLKQTRLDLYRFNQKKTICELYYGIYDCVRVGENRAKEVGKRTVLPASFIGGPRDMGHRYMDVMALVQ